MTCPLRAVRYAALGVALLVSGFTAERLADLRRGDEPAANPHVQAVASPEVVPGSDASLHPAARLVSLGGRLPMGHVQGPVSSPFGWRRHPVSGRVRHHNGVDLAVPAGTAVWTVAPGRVRAIGRRRGYGLVVELDHAAGLGRRPVRTLYAHLSAVDATLRPGSRVAQGQAIGASGGRPGRDGVSTGAHLHFEVLTPSGAPLDPGHVVRLLDAVRPADGAPRPFAPRVAILSGHERGEPVEASPAARDTVDIWPAAAPGLPQAEQLPDLVLPDYPYGGMVALPTTLLIDRDGLARYRLRGLTSQEQLRPLLQDPLAETPSTI